MRIAMTAMAMPFMVAAALVSADDDCAKAVRGDRKTGNAALDYWQALECLMAHHPDDVKGSPAHLEFLRTLSEGHTAPLDGRAREAVARSGMALYFLHRGSRVGACDWGLAFDELGPADEQGHLAQTPFLVGAACLRARYYFEHDMSQEATADVIALLRLGKHMGNEGHDGTRGLLSQLSAEKRAIDIVAGSLPQMDAACARRIGRQMTGRPVPEILKNFLAAQKKQWVDWPTKFAQHARDQEGDWDAYWRKIAVRGDWRTEVGDLLREAASERPDRLLTLAREAAGVFDEATKLADLPEEEFRPAWRSILRKSADQNPIVELAGGEVEPILDALVLGEARRALCRAGIVVAQKGPRVLKDLKEPSGPFEHRKTEGGFELTTKRTFGGKPLKLVFGQPGDTTEGS